MRIGLFGGSFDPIHFGHLISARSILEQLDLDRVILIPSIRPPHKSGASLSEARHRLEMARLAVAGDRSFEVSDIESRRPGPSYTIDTVGAMRGQFAPDTALVWIIGADTLPELPSWHRVADLVKRAHIVTAARPGWEPPDASVLSGAIGLTEAEALIAGCLATPRIDISATEIRTRVRAGRSIRFLVPEAVASYIDEHGLYRIEPNRGS